MSTCRCECGLPTISGEDVRGGAVTLAEVANLRFRIAELEAASRALLDTLAADEATLTMLADHRVDALRAALGGGE